MIQTILPILQLMLTFGNICILGYAFVKFLGKPQTTLVELVKSLEKRIDLQDQKLYELERSLDVSHEKHREQEDTNEVMQTCMLALIDFELAYCIHTNYVDTEDLVKAKDVLRKHLAKK